jgi:primary-amine oxidase
LPGGWLFFVFFLPEEWPIMPTEWVHTLLKPWNFFDETPTLGKKKDEK